jgi:thioredoxin reductase/NAD-dependent dihydropyrimidine dehydrogenase PreA subunit
MLTMLVLSTGVTTTVLALLIVAWTFHRQDQAREVYEEAVEIGSNKPPGLHPVVDLDVCIGSGACVDACPEDVLALVDGKPHLVDAGSCVGHGACRGACPLQAISLNLGTIQRGVELPSLRPSLETNVGGIYVAGELGGRGLIRNAFRQGIQAVESAADALGAPARRRFDLVDLVIVGAGPAGVAAALKATELGLSFRLLDQYELGGSINHYPRKKLVLSERVELPLVGRFGRREMRKEELVEELERVVNAAGIGVFGESRVTAVKGRQGRFAVHAETPRGEEIHHGRALVLAIGRRGTPRQLGVPGEDQSHVVYMLKDAEQYRGRHVLVVGGGDSAVEAALALAGVARTMVHLSYRQRGFFRVKRKNRERLEQAVGAGRVALHLETTVARIGRSDVTLEGRRGRYVVDCDDVIVNAGGVLPTRLLESMGVAIDIRHGEALENPAAPEVHARRLAKRARLLSSRLTQSAPLEMIRRASGRLVRAG